jgi:hypothetical protein
MTSSSKASVATRIHAALVMTENPSKGVVASANANANIAKTPVL